MFIIPKIHRRDMTTEFGRSYSGSRIIYDAPVKQTELEKKYSPMISKLNNLIKEIDTDIKQSARRVRDIVEQFPKKVDLEVEVGKTRASLYTTKMNALKMMMGALKDIKDMEMKEQKLIHEMTGKVVDVRGGDGMMKASMATMLESTSQKRQDFLHTLPSYGGTVNNTNITATPVENVASKEPIVATPIQFTEPTNNTTNLDTTSKPGFSSLFAKTENPDSSAYIKGNNNMGDYEKIDNRFSHGSAQTGLKNKYITETEQKVHYDEEIGVGWIRTYKKGTNTFADEEAFIPPSFHGKFQITSSGDIKYAISETDENYDIVPDKIDNVPKEIKKELYMTYGLEYDGV